MSWRSRSRAQRIVRGLPEQSHVCMSALAVCTHCSVLVPATAAVRCLGVLHGAAQYCLLSQPPRVTEDSPISAAMGPKLIVPDGRVHTVSSSLKPFLCECFYTCIVHAAMKVTRVSIVARRTILDVNVNTLTNKQSTVREPNQVKLRCDKC